MTKWPKIGLALGSGGIRGLAHIAVIKALENNNIPIDFIAGSSIGAMIGGLYAYKADIRAVEDLILSLNRRKVFSLFFKPIFNQGLVSNEKIMEFFNQWTNKADFKDLKIPFGAVATDIKTGRTVVINQENLARGITASGCVPLVFKPINFGDDLLIDGGTSNPVPVSVVKNMGAEFVIAVNLNKDFFVSDGNDFNTQKIVNTTMSIILHHLAKENCKEADFVFYPNVKHKGQDLFINQEEKKTIIEENYKLAHEKIEQLKLKMKKKRRKSGLLKFLGI